MEDNFKVRDFRNKQFFMVDDEYLNGYARLCGLHATGVYFSLCRHANKDQVCFPSKKLIAKELSMSERSVYTGIKNLEEWGIVRVQGQGRKPDGSFKNLVYVLLDKSKWKSKPSANGAVGKKQLAPSANDDISRRHHVPNKETHKEGNTYKDIASLERIDKTKEDISNLVKKFRT